MLFLLLLFFFAFAFFASAFFAFAFFAYAFFAYAFFAFAFFFAFTCRLALSYACCMQVGDVTHSMDYHIRSANGSPGNGGAAAGGDGHAARTEQMAAGRPSYQSQRRGRAHTTTSG